MLDYTYVMAESWMKVSERNVHNLFNISGKELSDRKRIMLQDIDNWRNDFIHQMDEHVRQQKRLLEQEYNTQKYSIDSIRQQFLDAVRQHEYRGQNEQIHHLLEQCKALQFALGALDHLGPAIPFIQFMTDEQLERKKRNESKTKKIDDNISGNNLDKDYDNNSSSASARQTSTTPNQLNRPASTAGQTSADMTNSNSNTGDQSGWISKCLTCYMIFPSSMSLEDRNRHMTEHF